MSDFKIGIIGGTGFYEMDGFTDKEEITVETPFGKPSDNIITGKIAGKKVAFISRHSRGHRILPSELNQQANIWALKSLGVKVILAASAVGSLKEEIVPGDIVLPDQIIDKTKNRPGTFFGNGLVAHVAFAEPFCDRLRNIVHSAAKTVECKTHFGGTYVCMEGPLFSTRAESNLHRSWGASVIGMTAIPESKLAREAEMCYASIALATDYDCWREEEEAVTSDSVMETVKNNSIKAQKIIVKTIEQLNIDDECLCQKALSTALVTPKDLVPEETYKKVELLVKNYM